MRAFGPGSISSFLRATLDVAYAVLWAALLALLGSAAAALLWQPFLGRPGRESSPALREAESLLRHGPQLLLLSLAGAACLGALILITDRLRRVFRAMSAGDPFHPDNVRRLREAGIALLALQLAGYGLRATVAALFPTLVSGFELNLSGWFATLVVFVLAEVFREGARLRAEAELTI